MRDAARGPGTTTDPGPALFGCEDIYIRLGGRPILEGISVSIRPGEILGVVGPNGAGKTTLFEVLCGRYVPDSGRVTLAGRDITSLKLFARARLFLRCVRPGFDAQPTAGRAGPGGAHPLRTERCRRMRSPP